MSPTEVMSAVGTMLEEARTAVLTTVDAEGRPHARWMTPTTLRARPNALFALTARGSKKTVHLEANPHATWLVQRPALTEIVELKGKVNLVDNASLTQEVVEELGGRLTHFWRINPQRTDLVVLETVIEEAVHLLPMKGSAQKVPFK